MLEKLLVSMIQCILGFFPSSAKTMACGFHANQGILGEILELKCLTRCLSLPDIQNIYISLTLICFLFPSCNLHGTMNCYVILFWLYLELLKQSITHNQCSLNTCLKKHISTYGIVFLYIHPYRTLTIKSWDVDSITAI